MTLKPPADTRRLDWDLVREYVQRRIAEMERWYIDCDTAEAQLAAIGCTQALKRTLMDIGGGRR
jgi:hypothetical protein